MAHLGRALGYGIESAERRHHGACRVNLDGQAPIAHGGNALGEAHCTGAKAGKIFRPSGDHAPLNAIAYIRRAGRANFCLLAERAIGGTSAER